MPVSHSSPDPKAASETVAPPLFLHSFPFQLREASPGLAPPGWQRQGWVVRIGVSVGCGVDPDMAEEAGESQDD